MTNRLDALMAREYKTNDGEVKTAFTKIGVAFETRNGGWSVTLDAIPAPVDGQYKIVLLPPKEKGDRNQRASSGQDELDSQIPF